MKRLISHLDTSSENYKHYREHNLALSAELKARLHAARYERPQRAFDRLAEQNKLTVRKRLELLLDPGSPFLELSPLVKAATGEDVTADELGGADVQTALSGTADYAVDTEEEGIALVREIVGVWKRTEKTWIDFREPEDPYYDPDELYGILPDDIKK